MSIGKYQNLGELSRLLSYLKTCEFNIIMVEGIRGVGKSTFTEELLSRTSFTYYKTWGRDQKNSRFLLEEKGLELPQGTYFVLDFLSQVRLSDPVVADRSILSALAYQMSKYISKKYLHQYYVRLMRSSRACIAVLDSSREVVLRRRVGRKSEDEHNLAGMDEERARSIVQQDCWLYNRATQAMVSAGLGYRDSGTFALSEEDTCTIYAPKELLHEN